MKTHWLNACPTITWLRVRVLSTAVGTGREKGKYGMLSAQTARNGYVSGHSKNNGAACVTQNKSIPLA
jgi:hypothetical protein